MEMVRLYKQGCRWIALVLMLAMAWPLGAEEAVVLAIDSPKEGTQIGGVVSVLGSVQIDDLQSYRLSFGEGEDPVHWIGIGETRGEPLEAGRLALWDTTQIPDDIYSLRLRAITDGDIRRWVARNTAFTELAVEEVMTRNPRTIGIGTPAYDALNTMEHHQITVLPVTDREGRVLGILHLHDILGKGEFTFNGT